MRIAIPKGRLQSDVRATFANAGYAVPSESDLRTRKLLFLRGGVEWIFVKDTDVPVYVEHGAADAGIAGLDQILEHECSAYQPLDLPYGRCRMMLIGAPDAAPLSRDRPAKIATKYPRIARQYLDSRGLGGELVTLSGSVELAAVLGLTSHVIDLVETGETVRVHRLVLEDVVAEITPRLIVAKNFYRTSNQRARELIARVETAVKEANDAVLQSPLV
jgi:ATP phosphoribosyltransferase